MGYYCTVPQCTSLAGKTKNVKFHRFPRDVSMADKWNVILKRGKPYTKYSKVCSLHFTQSDYNVTTMGQWKTLSKDAVPSQNLPKLNPDGTVMVIRKSRTVKYREGRKDDITGEKTDKWVLPLSHTPGPPCVTDISNSDADIAYRLQTLSAIASTLSPQLPQTHSNQNHNQIPMKPKKQDAFMQTDPVPSEEDDTQPNNSYSETSDNSYNSEQVDYRQYHKDSVYKDSGYQKDPGYKDPLYQKEEKDYDVTQYQKDTKNYEEKKYESPKDYTKQEDYIPQTNEEYNKEAEKYALERKSHNVYDKIDTPYQKQPESYQKQPESYQKQPESYQKQPEPYQKQPESYQKPNDVYQKPAEVYQKPPESYQKPSEYQKIQDIYGFDKDYQNRDYLGYQNGYPDSVEILRNQQHNLQILQEQHRVTENQNFFNENHIKQEIDINSEEEKFLYERAKDQLDASTMYNGHRSLMQQQRLLEDLQQQRLLEDMQRQVKQEPETSGCESVMQPQGSPYYTPNGHNNVSGGYYEQLARPGPELLIAKQNALAAHTQLWQNTMKRPFFYSESPHYASQQLLHRYSEDLTRILQ